MSERKHRDTDTESAPERAETESTVPDLVPGVGPAFAQDPTTQEEAPLDIPAGHRALTYVGSADVVRYGAFVFRPGQPVIVPSDVAEELLTTLSSEPFDTKE